MPAVSPQTKARFSVHHLRTHTQGILKLRIRQAISHPNRTYFVKEQNRPVMRSSPMDDCPTSPIAAIGGRAAAEEGAAAEESAAAEEGAAAEGRPLFDSDAPQKGDLLFFKYEFDSIIGEGGMGVIYKCKHPLLNKFVAIKTLNRKQLAEEALIRFHREAKAACLLSHPNLIAVHDFGVSSDGRPYMVMDYVEGKTLSAAISEGVNYSLPQTLDIFIQCCEGLMDAHAHKVLHRDIKSSNIILTGETGQSPGVKIVDFGIAKILRKDEKENLELTKTGDVFGSPLYMSPEQGGGTRRVDHRTDIYSLGCVFYEALTGCPPFIGDSAIETLIKHVSEKPQSLKTASLGREYPKDLEDLVMQMLEKDPARRPQSMAEVKGALVSVRESSKAARDARRILDRASKTVQALAPPSIPVDRIIFLSCAFLILSLLVAFALWSVPDQGEKPLSDTIENYSSYTDRDEEHTMMRQMALDIESVRNSRSTRLALRDRLFSRAQIELLCQASWLKELEIRHCDKVSADMLRSLRRLKLKALVIFDTDLDDRGIAELAEFNSLDRLDVEVARNTSARGLERLSALSNLSSLTLSHTPCDDSTVEALSNMASLKELNLGFSKHITDQSIAIVVENMPRLESLTLDHCPITDRGVLLLPKAERLKNVSLSNNRQLTDRALDGIALMKELRTLSLSGTSVTGAGLLKLKGLNNVWHVDAAVIGRVTRSQWNEFKRRFGRGTVFTEPVIEERL